MYDVRELYIPEAGFAGLCGQKESLYSAFGYPRHPTRDAVLSNFSMRFLLRLVV